MNCSLLTRRENGGNTFKVPINPKINLHAKEYLRFSEQNAEKIFDFNTYSPSLWILGALKRKKRISFSCLVYATTAYKEVILYADLILLAFRFFNITKSATN